ncbi:hypothetical protein MLD38_013273 [Melastoma candidum]|uniref:Uncharacterized protein n=1 Tax=Melastoma candidum TaxID=119954 RepID=A0ACB9R946_9MYRT|nr:hypothetical protein MLD38_013273 [Melastoma candidum]
MDRISELPEPLLHSIMSLLSTRNVLRMSAISWRWKFVVDSFPFWDFDQDHFWRSWSTPKEEACRNCMDLAHRSLGKLTQDGLAMPPEIKFCVSLFSVIFPHVNSLLMDCIGMALDGRVKKLTLHVTQFDVIFTVPQSAFTSRYLTALDLQDCKFGDLTLVSEVGNRVLRKLSLFHVQVCTAELRLLFNCFPFVEDLTIKRCFPVRTVSVSGLPKLEVLDVQSDEVEVDAPALRRLRLTNASVDDDMIGNVITKCPLLEDFELVDPRGLHQLTTQGFLKADCLELFAQHQCKTRGIIETNVVMVRRGLRGFCFRCSPLALPVIGLNITTLKELEVRGVAIDPGHLLEGFFHRFPMLEKLRVSHCPKVMGINISCPMLKSIYVESCRKLDHIRVEAPKLQTFHYSSNRAPLLLSAHVSCPMDFMLNPDSKSVADISFFLRINALLSQLDRTVEVRLSIFLCKMFSTVEIPELRSRCVSTSRNLDELRIEGGVQCCSDLPSLVDAFLWSCRPKSIHARRGFQKPFSKALYAKIAGHNPMNVEMKKLALSSKRGKLKSWTLDTEQEPSPPFETFAELLRHFRGGEIHFKLHWSDTAESSGRRGFSRA